MNPFNLNWPDEWSNVAVEAYSYLGEKIASSVSNPRSPL